MVARIAPISFMIALLSSLLLANSTMVAAPAVAIGFQDKDDPSQIFTQIDVLSGLSAVDGIYSPQDVVPTGPVTADYYLTGKTDEYLDAISLEFDPGTDDLTNRLWLFRAYMQKGEYSDWGLEHFQLLDGTFRTYYQDVDDPRAISYPPRGVDYYPDGVLSPNQTVGWVEIPFYVYPNSYLSYVLPNGNLGLTLRLWNSRVDAVEVVPAPANGTNELPDSFDWRNVDGKNYMTPPKKQGSLQCWTFAAVGTLEAKVKIALNDPDLDVDLSEQHLFYQGEWFDVFRTTGIVTEEELPHKSTPQWDPNKWPLQPGWEDRTYTISEYQDLTGIADINVYKRALIEHGPLFLISQGRHAVTICGYVDDPEAEDGGNWIFKNTFGPDWGDGGYGTYRYSDMEIGLYVFAITGDVYYGGELLVPEPTALSLVVIGTCLTLLRRSPPNRRPRAHCKWAGRQGRVKRETGTDST